MTEWEPATDAEVAMRNALRTDDQESYFRILAGVDLLLPVSADALAGLAPLGWGTWSTGGRTHVLAFTSPSALQACLADYTGSARRVAYAELADTWPNLEWWLAVNPGLPIEGYLPAWFVAQLSRGDLRLPTRGPGRDGSNTPNRIQDLHAAATLAATAAAQGYQAQNYAAPAAGGPIEGSPVAGDPAAGSPVPGSPVSGAPVSGPSSGQAVAAGQAASAGAAMSGRPAAAPGGRQPGAAGPGAGPAGPVPGPGPGAGPARPGAGPASPGVGPASPGAGPAGEPGSAGQVGPGGLPLRTPGAVMPSGLPSRVPGTPPGPGGGRGDGIPGGQFNGFGTRPGERSAQPGGFAGEPGWSPGQTGAAGVPAAYRPPTVPVGEPAGPGGSGAQARPASGAGALEALSSRSGPGAPAERGTTPGSLPPLPRPDSPLPTRTPMAQTPPLPAHIPPPVDTVVAPAGPGRTTTGQGDAATTATNLAGQKTDDGSTPPAPGRAPSGGMESDQSADGRGVTQGGLPRRQVMPPGERPSSMAAAAQALAGNRGPGATQPPSTTPQAPAREQPPARQPGGAQQAPTGLGPPVIPGAGGAGRSTIGSPASGLPAPGLPASDAPVSGIPVSGAPVSGIPVSGPPSPSPAVPARDSGVPAPAARPAVPPTSSQPPAGSAAGPAQFGPSAGGAAGPAQFGPSAGGAAGSAQAASSASQLAALARSAGESADSTPVAEQPAGAAQPASAQSASPPPGAARPAGSEPSGYTSGPATGNEYDEDFVPANEVERDLHHAVDESSTDSFLSTLLLATVLVPVADNSRPGSAPGESGFAFRTEEVDGDRFLVVFTSRDRLAEHFAEPTRTVGVRFVDLIRNWPDPAWSFAVNPTSPIGARYPGPQVIALASWAVEAGLGGDPIEPPVEQPQRPAAPTAQLTTMQKAVPAEQIDYYLERGYDRVAGFVHRAGEVEHLRSPGELFSALGLLYDGSPYQADAKEAFVLRWPAHRPSLYRIPYGGQSEQALRAMDGWVIERPPFRGNGFAPGEGNDVIAEFKVDSVRLPHGAQLWRMDAEGTEQMIAVFDCDAPVWRRVGGQ